MAIALMQRCPTPPDAPRRCAPARDVLAYIDYVERHVNRIVNAGIAERWDRIGMRVLMVDWP